MSKETGSALSAIFLAVVKCEISLGSKCTIKLPAGHSTHQQMAEYRTFDGREAVVVGFYPTGSNTPTSVNLKILTGPAEGEVVFGVNTASLQFEGTFKKVER